MTRSAKCKAKGGVSACRSASCPEKQARWLEDRTYVQATLLRSTWPAEIMGEMLTVIDDLRTQWGNPIVGRTRAVFDTGDGWVLKVPLNDEGVTASMREQYQYAADKEREAFIPVAPCEFKQVGERWYLRMVRVEPVIKPDYAALPDWVGYVDCAQVGYTADGRLVAYDL